MIQMNKRLIIRKLNDLMVLYKSLKHDSLEQKEIFNKMLSLLEDYNKNEGLISGCTCTSIINECKYHELEKEEFMIRAYIKQMQENMITLHERLRIVERLLIPERVDITPLVTSSLEYCERKMD